LTNEQDGTIVVLYAKATALNAAVNEEKKRVSLAWDIDLEHVMRECSVNGQACKKERETQKKDGRSAEETKRNALKAKGTTEIRPCCRLKRHHRRVSNSSGKSTQYWVRRERTSERMCAHPAHCFLHRHHVQHDGQHILF